MTKRLAIFDCDGTLVDSQANICRAMEMAFAAEGLGHPDHHRVRRIVGLSLVEAMRVMLPEAEPQFHVVLADHYKNAFHELRGNGTLQQEPLYDGLTELLDRLDRQGWMLAVATGKSDRGLDLCLTHHGIKHRFVSLQTADRHPSKPHPSMIYQALADAGAEPHAAVMIGDTSYDMAMGVAANVRAIGVDWGYHDAAELTQAGADSIAYSMDELFDHIAQGAA
ncbi:HAD-IA family hydrolase [Blastomonas fulva]|jgi:phosphoglycolate phosphatase|uniref:HAD-IA family hydrolase n=1 Tax=Blastomonas fulva TaxID=1550728 RepID=UPI0025A44F58|nr:HAD-IA family hydrolase [Blastomonas fulva]MDM7929915.1 HAD-IA family hydrolase [Blastomonas fulva]MDM7966876.1 HAD-IA family hydrolase [Blastomonas fulva]